MTNGDLWRKMTNEELAVCISMLSNKCYKDILENLNAEVNLSMGVRAKGFQDPNFTKFIKELWEVQYNE